MAKRLAAALGILVIALCAHASPTAASWLPGGTPVCTVAGQQSSVSASADGQGGVYIAWSDPRVTLPGIYLQRLTHDGDVSPGWPANGLLVMSVASAPRAVADGSGGCYVVWVAAPGGGGNRVIAKHVLGAGLIDPVWPVGGVEFSHNDGSTLLGAAADALGSLIVWYRDHFSVCDESGCHAFFNPGTVSRLNINGSMGGGTGFLSSSSGALVACPDLTGGVWISTNDDFRLQDRFMPPSGPVVGVWPSTNFPVQFVFTIAAASDGGAFLSWPTGCGGGSSFSVQRLLASGNPAPGWPSTAPVLCAASGFARGPIIISAGGKRPLIAWNESTPSGSFRLGAASLDTSGALAAGWPSSGAVLCDAPGLRSISALVPDGLGGGLTAWQDGRDSRRDLYATHLGGNGALAPGWPSNGTLIATTLGLVPFPQVIPVVTDGFGGAIVAWIDARDSSTTGYDVYAERLQNDGPVPAQLSLVSADVRDGAVFLDWFSPDAATLSATVFRRTDVSDWVSLGVPAIDGSGHLRYEDHAVTAGSRVDYRLGYVDQGVQRFTGETWVDVPEMRFTLEGLRPNPASGALTVSFSLRNSEPASLEVVDLGGRRVAQRDVGSLGAGPHLVELGETRTLRPGVYWLRLRQGSQVLQTRGSVVH